MKDVSGPSVNVCVHVLTHAHAHSLTHSLTPCPKLENQDRGEGWQLSGVDVIKWEASDFVAVA